MCQVFQNTDTSVTGPDFQMCIRCQGLGTGDVFFLAKIISKSEPILMKPFFK